MARPAEARRAQVRDNAEVEKALFRRATGYEYQEDTFSPEKEGGELTLARRVIRHERPDVAAIRFWLSSRMPEKWGPAEPEGEDPGGGVVLLPEVKP